MGKQESIKETNKFGCTVDDFVVAYKHSALHRAKLEQDDVGGCFTVARCLTPRKS